MSEYKLHGSRAGGTGIAVCALLLTAQPANAAEFKVLYTFTGGINDGGGPNFFVRNGRNAFIGTTGVGGAHGQGTIFKLFKQGSNWEVKALYAAQGNMGALGFGAAIRNDKFYASTASFGVWGGPCGGVYEVDRSTLTGTREKHHARLIHRYVQTVDGCPNGTLTFDKSGNAYGVTQSGGPLLGGSIFELSPAKTLWQETILYSFKGYSGGSGPHSGPIMDRKGNLYGTTYAGGHWGVGSVYELQQSPSGWKYTAIHTFQGKDDGGRPEAGLVMDKDGNLFGANSSNGPTGDGVVFELSPTKQGWIFHRLANLRGQRGPTTALVLDRLGNLYGSSVQDGKYGHGSVFKLTPTPDGWQFTNLHDFVKSTDGAYPWSGITLDDEGNLFGTTSGGGANDLGTIYEITP